MAQYALGYKVTNSRSKKEDNDVRDGFIFYESFRSAMKDLPAETQLLLYNALADYALYDIEPDFDTNGIARGFFALMRPQIDANNRRRDAGARGGRPVKSQESEPNEHQTETNEEPNRNLGVTDEKPNGNLGVTEAKPSNNQTVTKPEPKEKEKEKAKEKPKGNDKEKEHAKHSARKHRAASPNPRWRISASIAKSEGTESIRNGFLTSTRRKAG